MVHLQVTHRIFQGRARAVQAVIRRIGGDEIGDVAHDEQLTRQGAGEDGRVHTRIEQEIIRVAGACPSETSRFISDGASS